MPSFKNGIVIAFFYTSLSTQAFSVESENELKAKSLLDSTQVYELSDDDRMIFGERGAGGHITEEDLDLIQKSEEMINSPQFQEELQEIRDQADAINQAVLERSVISVPNSREINTEELAQFVLDTMPNTEHLADIAGVKSTGEELPEPTRKLPDEQQILWIFVSSSMPEMQMKKALQTAAEWGARVVYRGIRPQDVTIGDLQRFIYGQQVLLETFKYEAVMQADSPEDVEETYTAGIYLDSMAFQRFKIESVPTMVYERRLNDGGKKFGIVKGLISPAYLQGRVEDSIMAGVPDQIVDLGEMALTFGIDERDWVEESKERLARIDWEKQKQDAIKRYWQRRHFEVLPPAQLDETLIQDPTVEVTQSVTAIDGTVIARAGEQFNPVRYLPVPVTIYVFDATDPKEVAFIKHQSLAPLRGHVKLIATQIDRDLGFDHLTQLKKELKRKVDIMTPDIVNHFSLRATPARITTNQRAMYQIDYYSQQTVRALEADKDEEL
ncbi:TrbC family F-type conjugative pilus assembly protein [Vibrio owensii]|uniref:TrbC family F-type conjugative pilus assembly protein n=1 Tax=Vibrio owensii TaxID=696485 RepID=UPI0040685B8D